MSDALAYLVKARPEAMTAYFAFLKDAEARNKWDPPSLFTAVGESVRDMTKHFAGIFGSAGKA